MTIEKRVELYEILLRFSGGVLSGANARQLEKLVDKETGEVLSERELNAEPVNLEYIDGLLHDDNTGLVASLSAAMQEIETLTMKLSEVESHLVSFKHDSGSANTISLPGEK